MSWLVTGTSGLLGSTLAARLRREGTTVVGLDVRAGAQTDCLGTLASREDVDRAVAKATAGGQRLVGVVHAGALHKPDLAERERVEFVDVNIRGTLNVLEAVPEGTPVIVCTTTSLFGHALVDKDARAAVWIDEDVVPRVKNMYGASKEAAEIMCRLMHQVRHLPIAMLRLSRFFQEEDDDPGRLQLAPDRTLKMLEYLHRRVHVDDAVQACLDAHAALVDGRVACDAFIIAAPTPFVRGEDEADLLSRPEDVVRRRCGDGIVDTFLAAGHTFIPIDRVYDSGKAVRTFGWSPVHTFAHVAAGDGS